MMKSLSSRHRLAVLLLGALLLVVSACGSDAADTAGLATSADDSAVPVEDAVDDAPETVATASVETVDPADAEANSTEAAETAPDDDGGTDVAAPVAAGDGVDTSLFFDGALAVAPTSGPCTLSGGAETTCLQVTIAGFPADGDVGPFCPRTIDATADEVGIWFDGDARYDIDGQFIVDLPEIYGDGNWRLYDEAGNVNVTETAEAFDAAARPDVDPEYQNHCVEGAIEWLTDGAPITTTVQIPAIPVAAEAATRINGSVGVTLNGVIIDGQAPVDAILGAYTIAAFDDCGGHINPVAGYHIHGATGCSELDEAEAGETPMFAYALDGFPIHSPLDPGDTAAANLDECNGHTTEASGYHYHAAQAEENGVLTCFIGQAVNSGNGRGSGPGAEAAPAAAVPADDSPDETVEVHASAADVGFLGSYSLIDESYGTMVSVTVDGDTRTIVSNSIPDHETGDFPNSGNPNTISEQSLVLDYPAVGTWTGDAGFAQMPGIAVNGIAFEPGTAETVTCASGENYRIEGLQDLYNLGMDFNNAHVQPNGQYHYHGIAELLVTTHSADDDLALVGFAADGFRMFYSKSGAYESSYVLATADRTGSDCTASGPAGGSTVAIAGSTPDGTYGSDWEYVDGGGVLDRCNGTEIDGSYAYVLTDDYPYIPRCLNGEFTATGPGAGGGAGPGAGAGERQPGAGADADGEGRPGGGPDFSGAADALGISEDELLAALGGPPPDLDAAAATLGITVEELEAVMPAPPGR